ncbi:MAG: hypothetical protein MI922_23955 [Bacteroidales bacterium]|nr:hypothetical protein [Bacteroidales bacterium]
MKYCCDPFYHALANAGKKGFAVVVSGNGDSVIYYMQTRICDFDAVDDILAKFKSLPEPLGVSLPFQMQKKIAFCPFCGKKLDNLMQTFQDETIELIELHKKYVNP